MNVCRRILQLRCSTHKSKAETPLQNHEKTDIFEDGFSKNGEVEDDFKHDHEDDKFEENILAYITEDVSKDIKNWYNLLPNILLQIPTVHYGCYLQDSLRCELYTVNKMLVFRNFLISNHQEK